MEILQDPTPNLTSDARNRADLDREHYSSSSAPSSRASTPNSLFDTDEEELETVDDNRPPSQSRPAHSLHSVASTTCPHIAGLYLFPEAISRDLQHQIAAEMSATVWPGGTNQVMLFEAPSAESKFPPFLDAFINQLPRILEPLPAQLKDLIIFSGQPRQAILNLYTPGTGISRHIDLPDRYDDGIVGLSLGGSAVMDFEHAKTGAKHSVLLRPGDVYVLSGEARWDWAHGIAYRTTDIVKDDEDDEPYVIHRKTRMSITLRRMKPGADLVGP